MKRTVLVLLTLASLYGCRKAPAAAPTTGSAQPVATPAPATAGSTAPGQPGQPPPVVAKPMPANLPNVLAKVNGDPVERWELEVALKRTEARNGSPLPADKRDEVLRGILDQLITFHTLDQTAHAQKIVVSDTDVNAQIAQMRQGFPTDEAFRQGIAQQGLTIDQLKRQARLSLEVQRLIETEINAKVTVVDSDVLTFYQQNLARFQQGETVHASHILIAVPQNATADQKTQARAKAQQILKQIRGGSDFAQLAKAQSQDPGSAPNGGDLGFFPKGQMVAPFEDAAFKLKDNTVSEIVETPFGFHIIKVLGRRPPRTVPIEEAGGQIKDYLVQDQRQTRLQQYIDQVKTKTKIEILV
jgi:peptidyl-prolyl cis-trans isomerase C